jgi:hypothetical protein
MYWYRMMMMIISINFGGAGGNKKWVHNHNNYPHQLMGKLINLSRKKKPQLRHIFDACSLLYWMMNLRYEIKVENKSLSFSGKCLIYLLGMVRTLESSQVQKSLLIPLPREQFWHTWVARMHAWTWEFMIAKVYY